MKIVTAAEANRQFSAVLREVAQGESVLVTSRGKPVATIMPARQTTDGKGGLPRCCHCEERMRRGNHNDEEGWIAALRSQ